MRLLVNRNKLNKHECQGVQPDDTVGDIDAPFAGHRSAAGADVRGPHHGRPGQAGPVRTGGQGGLEEVSLALVIDLIIFFLKGSLISYCW